MGELSDSTKLYVQAVKNAMQNLFNDSSVPKEDTRAAFGELREELESFLDALNE